MTEYFFNLGASLVVLLAVALVSAMGWRTFKMSRVDADAEMAPVFISWYREPVRERITYLAKREPDGNSPSSAGYYYTPDQTAAYHFETRAAAEKATPIYDGSDGIKERSGVFEFYTVPRR